MSWDMGLKIINSKPNNEPLNYLSYLSDICFLGTNGYALSNGELLLELLNESGNLGNCQTAMEQITQYRPDVVGEYLEQQGLGDKLCTLSGIKDQDLRNVNTLSELLISPELFAIALSSPALALLLISDQASRNIINQEQILYSKMGSEANYKYFSENEILFNNLYNSQNIRLSAFDNEDLARYFFESGYIDTLWNENAGANLPIDLSKVNIKAGLWEEDRNRIAEIYGENPSYLSPLASSNLIEEIPLTGSGAYQNFSVPRTILFQHRAGTYNANGYRLRYSKSGGESGGNTTSSSYVYTESFVKITANSTRYIWGGAYYIKVLKII